LAQSSPSQIGRRNERRKTGKQRKDVETER